MHCLIIWKHVKLKNNCSYLLFLFFHLTSSSKTSWWSFQLDIFKNLSKGVCWLFFNGRNWFHWLIEFVISFNFYFAKFRNFYILLQLLDIEFDTLRQLLQASFHEMGTKYSILHETFHEIIQNKIFTNFIWKRKFKVFNWDILEHRSQKFEIRSF